MKILLLNDNPVVRKLVALSAQKTKDDLSVIWSVDEVEDGGYDLLIVDDAHYSDESMAALKEKIQYKTSLLMATRGNATPSGFDKVINKPFLPTDLVDLFAQISQSLSVVSEEKSSDTRKDIVLDDAAEDDENINLDDFDIEDDHEMAAKTNVLDHEEVQELQDLLDDTDSFELDDELSLDDLMEDTEMTDSGDVTNNDDLLESLDDDILQALEGQSTVESAENELEAMEEFDFDEDLLASESKLDQPIDESFDDEDLLGSLDDLLALDDEEISSEGQLENDNELDDLVGLVDEEETGEETPVMDEEVEDFDALSLDDIADMDEDEALLSLESVDDALSDDEFGELEQQIQEAVEELGIEDLEQGLDGLELGDMDEFEGLGDLDSLSERDIKLAIGEEVEEEELEVRTGEGEHASLNAEALGEAMAMVELDDEDENSEMDLETMSVPVQGHHGTPAEGMDALQALLKALSNEEVAKTLKGLSINININFGNEK